MPKEYTSTDLLISSLDNICLHHLDHFSQWELEKQNKGANS